MTWVKYGPTVFSSYGVWLSGLVVRFIDGWITQVKAQEYEWKFNCKAVTLHESDLSRK